MAQRALAQACLYYTREARKRNLHPIPITLRTMPIRMISTMTIMMISGTMRMRKTTGKRIIDLQPEKTGRGTSPRPLIKQIVNYNDVS